MTFALRVILPIVFLCAFLGAPAAAQDVQFGTGPICDTQKQTERVVALLDGGAETAIKVVNAEENDPTACVVATVAYLRGPQLATARGKAGSYQIVKILVIGLQTAQGVLMTEPAAYFTIVKLDEQEA
jgi:hypothetical protein